MKRLKTTMMSCIALGLLLPGCGKEEPADKATADKSSSDKGTEAQMRAEPAAAAKKELAPPPEDVYEGMARIVNLAMVADKPVAIDVWATQSFKYAPVLLAENIAFGEATKWFKSPKGSPVKAFVTGTKPDSKDDLGSIMHPKKGEHISAFFYNDKKGKKTTGNYWDTSDDASKTNTPDAIAAGKGYVRIRADQLKRYEKAMTDITGGWAFRVGGGKDKCLHQRNEDVGYQAALLGGTQSVELDLDPGTHTITFHKGMQKDCKEADKIYQLELEVKADQGQMVVLYTADAKELKHGVFDLPSNTAKPTGTNKKIKDDKDAARAAKKAAKEAEAAK